MGKTRSQGDLVADNRLGVGTDSIGIGTTNPTANLEVRGDAKIGVLEVGIGNTDVIVTGDMRVTGILTVGSSSLTLDGTNDVVNVGTALTLGHTQGVQFHTQNLHSDGFDVNNINASGVITATSFVGDGANLTGLQAGYWEKTDAGINTSTNIGIGTTNPTSALTVSGDANVTGVITATSFVGDGSNLTGLQAGYFEKTDAGINTSTNIGIGTTNPTSALTVSGDANVTGVITATSFVGNFTGNATGLSGSPSITVTDITASGNVSIAGTLTYEDVTNVDSVGLITARNGVDVTGNITVTGTVDGRDVATDGSKLDGIESGATADQTASEILTSIKTVDGAGSGLDADLLDGIQGSSFVRNDVGDQQVQSYLTINDSGNFSVLEFEDASNVQRTHVYHANSGGYAGIGVFDSSGANRKDLLLYQNGTITWNSNTIWHAGNDGSGTGLDADTVDGIQASNFVRSDVNDTKSGQLAITGSGQYVGNYGYSTLVLQDTSGYPGIDFRSGTKDWLQRMEAGTDMQWVYRNNGNYTEIMELTTGGVLTVNGNTVWHAGNDGSGSGLDADLWDGNQFDSYLNQSVKTNAQPLFGTGTSASYIRIGDSVTDNNNGSWNKGVHLNATNHGRFRIRTTNHTYGALETYYWADSTASPSMGIYGNSSTFKFTGSITTLQNKDGNTFWHAGNDGSGSGLDADSLDGLTWDSSGKNVRATEFYADNWFRNYNDGEGLYNESTGVHWHADGDGYWTARDGSNHIGIKMKTNGSTVRGYVYANNSNEIGFLDSDGNWAIKHVRDSRTEFLINNTEYAEINTDYLTHTSDIRTPIFYDSNNTGYYCDPASTSRFNAITPNIINCPYSGVSSGLNRASYPYSFGFQQTGGWSSPYPDLVLQYHTGVTLAANAGYEGISFKADYNSDTVIFRVNGGSSYTYKYTWMYTNTNGFYSDTNGWHIEPNTLTSYGSMNIRGSRSGWYGISFHEADNDPHLMFDNSGNGRGGLYWEGGGRWAYFYDHSNNSLGICGSSTSSSYRLYVSGPIYSTGDITAYSDRRKKTNIETIENALDKVLNLRGVTYNKLDIHNNPNEKTETGVIAQEVEEVFPEVVSYAEDVDEYGVSYGNFAGLFIEAFKEQQKTINMLKEEVENLKLKLGE